MALSKEEQDKKDYQDYVDYQKYVASTRTNEGEPATGFVNSVKASIEGLERGMTGGLSDAYQNMLSKKAPSLSSGSAAELEARRAGSPVLSKITEKIGGMAVAPVTTVTDSLGVPDGPEILPHNDYLNPTYGGTAKGVGDIALAMPEFTLKMLSKMRPALESMSGLTKPAAKAWATNPELVTQLKEALESQKLAGVQDMAGEKLKTTVDALKERGMNRAKAAASMLGESKLPYSTADLQMIADNGGTTAQKILHGSQSELDQILAQGPRRQTLAEAQAELASKYAEMGLGHPPAAEQEALARKFGDMKAPALSEVHPTLEASGPDIYALTQEAGEAYKNSRIDKLTGAHIPKDKNLGRIWFDSRNAMKRLPDVGPEIDAMMGKTAEEIGIQKALSPKVAANNPLTILNTSSPDQLARLDYLAKNGMPELQEASNAWQAAKNMSNVEFGRGAPGIGMPLHGISPKVSMLMSGINAVTGNIPKRASLWALPYAELGKSSPWMSMGSLQNPANAVRVISDTAKGKKDDE